MFSISKAKYASYMGPTLKLQDEGGGEKTGHRYTGYIILPKIRINQEHCQLSISYLHAIPSQPP